MNHTTEEQYKKIISRLQQSLFEATGALNALRSRDKELTERTESYEALTKECQELRIQNTNQCRRIEELERIRRAAPKGAVTLAPFLENVQFLNDVRDEVIRVLNGTSETRETIDSAFTVAINRRVNAIEAGLAAASASGSGASTASSSAGDVACFGS